MNKTELITVPTFIFNQGELLTDNDSEFPIQVTYWNDGEMVELKTLNYTNESIIIRTKDLKSLFKEIERHLSEATNKLKGK